MYEMYPDAWSEDQADRHQRTTSERPRRRSRKQHSVMPIALVPQPQPDKESAAG